MRTPTLALLAAALLTSTAPALALTPTQIELGSAKADTGVKAVTRRLASQRFGGRDNNTPESDKTQAYLIRKLRRLGQGLNPAGVRLDAYKQPFVQSGQIGTNLLAVIPGRELPNEYVIIGAHYDHLDTRSSGSGNCSTGNAPGGAVCPGATDNAAGVAAVLAIGRAIKKLPEPPRRSIVLALWDAEEDGLLGSMYYVANPLVPLAATKGYINFDILGANLMPSVANWTLAVSSETGGSAFGAFVDAAATADATVNLRRLSFIFGQLRSDYANFVGKNVPTVFFTDATNGCYHSTGDTIDIVNMDKLEAQSRIAFRLGVTLAESPTNLTFSAPPSGLATYNDAVSLNDVFSNAIADLPLFTPADQVIVQQTQLDIAAIVADGPANFDSDDVNTLLNAALSTLAAIDRVGCLPLP
ncbi:MAG TPA: M20/M25/M40 family metallo-hydrolase [Candidatus Binatia bacterium]|jgi:hypothetical protein|nr:M20/M25/M40 family metallo-hydrolase [Candidatus Binatia bacterium]